jgi:predicted cupin superfamily sugar epimerase
VVPGGVWQGCRLIPGGRLALMGTTVAPGFSYDDFELARREALLRDFPGHAAMIRDLTRE